VFTVYTRYTPVATPLNNNNNNNNNSDSNSAGPAESSSNNKIQCKRNKYGVNVAAMPSADKIQR